MLLIVFVIPAMGGAMGRVVGQGVDFDLDRVGRPELKSGPVVVPEQGQVAPGQFRLFMPGEHPPSAALGFKPMDVEVLIQPYRLKEVPMQAVVRGSRLMVRLRAQAQEQ